VVFDPSSTGDPILDRALGIMGTRQGRRPKAVLEPLGENLRTAPYSRLVAEGILRIVDPKEHDLTRKELQTTAQEISPGLGVGGCT